MAVDMNDPALSGWYSQLDDDTRDWLSMALYYRELETIRRDAPLFNPRTYPVTTLDLFDRTAQAQPQGAQAPQAPQAAQATQAAQGGVNLRGGSMPQALSPRLLWYKTDPTDTVFPRFLQRIFARAATVQVIDDDDDDAGSSAPQPPGPLTPMRPEIQNIRATIGYTKPFDQQFPQEIAAAKADTFMDQESMLQGPDWKDYFLHRTKNNALYKGFPMIEDVVFVKHPNYWNGNVGKTVASGQCYWLAVALLLYGDANAWIRVKAEHLSYLEKVLRDPSHPRHAFFTRENQSKTRTQATGPGDEAWAGDVNLWEKLLIPGCWANEDLCHLTADVYSVFLVLYKYDTSQSNSRWMDKVYDMKTYGSYNTRHIFMCYHKGNHFQPMVPNQYYAYEFRLPRLTLSNTKKYKLVTRQHRRRVRDGVRHHWRGQAHSIPASLGNPSFEFEHLARAVGYDGADGTKLQTTSTQPQSQAGLSTPNPVQGADIQPLTPDPTPLPNQTNATIQNSVGAATDAAASLQQQVNSIKVPTPHAAGGQATTTPVKPSSASSTSKGKRPAPSSTSPSSLTKRQRIGNTSPPQSGPSKLPSTTHKSPQRTPKTPSTVQHTGFKPINASLLNVPPIPRPTFSPPSSGTPQQPAQPPPHPPDTEFRNATRPMLTSKIRVDRLRKWCIDLALVAPHEVVGWKKKRFVDELLGVRLQVLMRHQGAGAGWVPVGQEEEDGRLVAVRQPLVVVVSSGEED